MGDGERSPLLRFLPLSFSGDRERVGVLVVVLLRRPCFFLEPMFERWGLYCVESRTKVVGNSWTGLQFYSGCYKLGIPVIYSWIKQ